MPTYTLKAGPLDFLGGAVAGETYRLDAAARGASFGEAELVLREVASQLLDGTVVRAGRYDNRTITLRVRVEGPDSGALARGGSALSTWANAPTTLTFTPPDGIGAATVWDVQTASVSWDFDLELESGQNKARIFTLTMVCLPFGSSASIVTIPALPLTTGTDVQINAAESLTGWSSNTAEPVGLDSGQKFEGTTSITLSPIASLVAGVPEDGTDNLVYSAVGDATLTLSSLANDGTRPYVSVKLSTIDAVGVGAQLWVNGAQAALQSITATTVPGWSLATFRTTVTAALTSIRIRVNTNTGGPGPAPDRWRARVDDVRWSGAPLAATPRELLRAIPVPGDRRTAGSLAIGHATKGLGKVLVYSHPALADGYFPALGRYYVATAGSTRTNDSAQMSGAVFEHVTGPPVFDVPLGSLPRGGFQLIAHSLTVVNPDEGTQVSATVQTMIGGTAVGPAQTFTRELPASGFPAGSLWAPLPMVLPVVDVPPGSPAVLRITVKRLDAAGTAITARYGEVFLCAIDNDAALTIVDCGGTGDAALGSANSRLWLDSAGVGASRQPAIFVGTDAQRADAYHAGAQAAPWDVPQMLPPVTPVFIANTGGINPTAEVSLRARFDNLATE